jgi:uncharacterized protein (TIRG00374 family)
MENTREKPEQRLLSKSIQRRRIRSLIQVSVGVGALILVLIKADGRGLVEALRATRLAYLPVAVLAALTVNWLMAYRWGLILRVRGYNVKTRRLFVYYLMSIFFMNFVPGGGVTGDIARLIYANREVRDRPFVLSTLVYERMVGLFTLLLVAFAATVAARSHLSESKVFYYGEAVLALPLLASAMLMSDYVSSRLGRLVRGIGKGTRFEWLGEGASKTLEAMSELRRHKKMLIQTFLVSVMVRAVWGIGWFIVAQAMGLSIGIALVMAFVSLVDLIRMLPISVGGLGVREWAIVMLFAEAGIEPEQALMFSFLVFAPIVLNAVAGGVIYTLRAGWLRPDATAAEVSTSGAEA